MDDVFLVSHSPEILMNYIVLAFDIKDKKYGPPPSYLGANVETFHILDGKYAWSIQCYSYVVSAVKTIKYLLSEDNRELKIFKLPHKGPLPHGYKP